MVGTWTGFFLHLLAAILFGVAGLLIIVRPAVSAEVITMFMAMFFQIGGLISTNRLHDCRIPWVGLAGSGWTESPFSWVCSLSPDGPPGLWVIGLFIGINLIVYGIAWITLALSLRGS